MRVSAISDTHWKDGWTIPPCDVFIHCGDLVPGVTRVPEAGMFFESIAKRMEIGDVGHFIFCPGNHDRCFWETKDVILGFITNPNIHVLIDEGIEIDGKKFWASPWTLPFMNWWYMADENKLRAIYGKMPWELDVLITHGPPKGILDPGFQEPHVGSISLRNAVEKRNIKRHVFGHLHGDGGKLAILGNTICHNVAAVDNHMIFRNPAVEFEI